MKHYLLLGLLLALFGNVDAQNRVYSTATISVETPITSDTSSPAKTIPASDPEASSIVNNGYAMALPVAIIEALPAASIFSNGHAPASTINFEPPATTERQPLAIVRRFRPSVIVRESTEPQWIEARMAQQLFDRDTLRTENDGYAVVQLVDNSLIRVRPNSMLVIRGETNERGGLNSRINVDRGTISLSVSGRQSEYEVGTQTAVAAVKGTSFRTTVNPDGSTTFLLFTGEITVMALRSGQLITMGPRNQATVDAEGNRIQRERLSRRNIQAEQNEEERLEQAATPSILRIRLVSPEGDVREIEIPYFRNGNK
jgi:hypothetical protein